ncbi:MAG: CDP-diacylglycerol--glycerol-3-phosphate 3-phosphatidyltransferase [Pigmentiphaga sp.]|nr:CDP-diacylglycerol--glycerol-3-phosphate 3-phosphatidyltransferase [Pigmentiphaga sp.]
MPINLPILLTWLRVLMIPLIVGMYYLPASWIGAEIRDLIATLMFIAAAGTDWLDGWLARRWNQTSSFGAFLDPVADKLMVSAALLVLLHLGRVDAMVTLIIIGREITISALREWMAKIGASGSVAVHQLGKLKTAVQMTAIPMLLYGHEFLGIDLVYWGQWLIIVAAILTVWSMAYYLQKAWSVIKVKSPDQ